LNGICKVKGYTFWHNVDVVKDRIWDYLELKFEDDVIFPELFGADFVVLGKNIPVEIQSTVILGEKGKDKSHLSHSYFEMMIEKQVKQDCGYFGKCWLFIDEEYLRYFQNEITKGARINFDWLYQLLKEEKLKIFTIDYLGNIRNTTNNDFRFIKEISMTCSVGIEDDHRILDRNKFNIINRVLKSYKYTSEELFIIRQKYDKTNNLVYLNWLQRINRSSREKLLGRILVAASTLKVINDILDVNNNNKLKLNKHNKNLLSVFGLLKITGASKGSVTVFEDEFGIAEYFPGYYRNKEFWDKLKGIPMTNSTLKKLINNEIQIDNIGMLDIEKNRGKKEIIREKLLHLNNFTQSELESYKNEFKSDHDVRNRIFQVWLMKSERSDRQKLLGNILALSTRIKLIEDFFNRIDIESRIQHMKTRETLNGLKIIESKKGGKHTKIRYIDKYGLSDLFDGFKENFSFWTSIKGECLNYDQFWSLIYGRK